MPSRKNGLNLSLWEFFILVLAIITTVATSYISRVQLKPGTYQVNSDCPNAKLNKGTVDGNAWNNRHSTITSTTTTETDSEEDIVPDTNEDSNTSSDILEDYHDDSVDCRTIDDSKQTYDFLLWFCRDKNSNDLVCTITFDKI